MPGFRPTYHMFVDRSVDGFPTYAVSISNTDPVYSNVFPVPGDGRIGFDLQTTGTLAGTYTLWYSNDEAPSLADDTDWEQATGWSPTNPAGSAIKDNYAVTDLKCRRWRVKFVPASGSGTLSGRANV